MLPDILGYRIHEGIELLKVSGISKGDIIVNEYISPRAEVMGKDVRILRMDESHGKITLIVGDF